MQVLDRVKKGDVLYRDVFFGSTPLAVEVLLPAVRIFGSEALVVRAATAAVNTATALACREAVRQLGVRDREASALMGLAVIVYGSPMSLHPPYSPLATLGQVACLNASLADAESGPTVPGSVTTGLVAGAAFAAKQNVGVATLAAAALCLRPWRRSRRAHALATLAGFSVAAGSALAPTFARGAGRKFIEYAFTNKRVYLRHASLSYAQGLRLLWEPTLPPPHRYGATKFAVPPATLIAVAARGFASRSPDQKERALLLGAHGAAALLGAFPRSDEAHVSWTLPPLLVGLAWALEGVPASHRTCRIARAVLWAWLGAGVCAAFAKPVEVLRSGRAEICRLPHHRGIVEDAQTIQRTQDKAEALGKLAAEASEGMFLLAPDAARYYLLSGIRNPTPFDYPYATAFGRYGELKTAEAVRRGEISTVLVDQGDGRLAAWGLITVVRDCLTPIGDVGGMVYRRASRSERLTQRASSPDRHRVHRAADPPAKGSGPAAGRKS